MTAQRSPLQDIRHGRQSSGAFGSHSRQIRTSFYSSRCSLQAIGFILGVSPFFTLSCFIAGGTLKRIRYFGYSEFNDFNGALFNIRTRSLNNLVYWLAQILGSVAMGFLLDQRGLSRRVRAFSGWCVLLIMVLVVHIWAYFYQKYVSCPS